MLNPFGNVVLLCIVFNKPPLNSLCFFCFFWLLSGLINYDVTDYVLVNNQRLTVPFPIDTDFAGYGSVQGGGLLSCTLLQWGVVLVCARVRAHV